ncbi:hypothetical protein ACPT9K_04980 [Haemophilus sp. HN_Hi19]
MATQLNSTQLNSTQLNSTQHNRYDELGYYSKPFAYTSISLLEGNATFGD